MRAKVVNKRARGPFDVYIGRPSRWGNPFEIGKDGTREEVIERFRTQLWADIQSGRVALKDLAELHGKTLACWCAPAACHGDVLADAAAWAVSELEKGG